MHDFAAAMFVLTAALYAVLGVDHHRITRKVGK